MRKEIVATTIAICIAICIAIWAPLAALAADWDCSDPVDTDYGQVTGVEEYGCCAWKGIPYAAPPVGELRWRAPQPHPGWPTPKKCDAFGDRCMQKGLFTAEGLTGDFGMSEDCLYLNIWRPRKSGLFPVMFWVHGGGYYGGTGASEMYWGDRLARENDIVVVSINYRVNVFGFFADPALRDEDPNGSAGSQGTLDQVEALKWVNRNIENFGGDPGNVTIFGESAGGWSICTLMATPLARGTFHRAILQSGGCTTSRDLGEGYAEAENIAKRLGCDPGDIDCLREVDAKKLLERGSGGMSKGLDFMPHHDGYVLTGTPLSIIRAGNYNKVPFMAGSNRDEFANALKLMPGMKYTRPENYEKKLMKQYGLAEEEAAEVARLYPLDEFDNRPVLAMGRAFGADASLACPTYEGLVAAAGQQGQTWHYRFDYDDMRFGKYTGAAHAMEIFFVFDSLDRTPGKFLYNDKNIGGAKKLQRIIQGYWVNFAKTGDPNGPGLPEWPEFRLDSRMVQVLDNEVFPEPAPNVERCEFWDSRNKNAPEAFESYR